MTCASLADRLGSHGAAASYRRRGIEEALNAASYPTWNPDHQLDVAEMTNAVGMLYDAVIGVPESAGGPSATEAATIRTAIVELGLAMGVQAFHEEKWFIKDLNNWNLVTNGGLIVGCLAVSGDVDGKQQAIVNELLDDAIDGINFAVPQFSGGVWPEGPAYQQYALEYAMYASLALRNAMGSDAALGPSLDQLGMSVPYLPQAFSPWPVMASHNWGDAGLVEHFHDVWVMFETGRRFGKPLASWWARQMMTVMLNSSAASGLLGSGDSVSRGLFSIDTVNGTAADLSAHPPTASYAAVPVKKQVALLRECWEWGAVGPDTTCSAAVAGRGASWASIKAGNNLFDNTDNSDNNHGHLDAGTFAMEMRGVRWLEDLGRDSYDLQGYFGKQRFNYYRLGSHGHSVLSFDGDGQSRHGNASIVAAASQEQPEVVLDMTAAYRAGGAEFVNRTVGFRASFSSFVISDSFKHSKANQVTWVAHTYALASKLSDGVLELTPNVSAPTYGWRGATNPPHPVLRATASVSSPHPCSIAPVWKVTEINLLPPQDPSGGTRRISLDVPIEECGREATIQVSFDLVSE